MILKKFSDKIFTEKVILIFMKSYNEQRRERLADAIFDYFSDDQLDVNDFWNDFRDEINDISSFYQSGVNRINELKKLMGLECDKVLMSESMIDKWNLRGSSYLSSKEDKISFK